MIVPPLLSNEIQFTLVLAVQVRDCPPLFVRDSCFVLVVLTSTLSNDKCCGFTLICGGKSVGPGGCVTGCCVDVVALTPSITVTDEFPPFDWMVNGAE